MYRIDRALAILLVLRSGEPVSATALARQFEVSTRTIYRDIETLSSVGVPVYAEMGRTGGFRLMDGYFLPPVMFSVREATSLLLGLSLLRSLHASPFAAERESGAQKLLAAIPERLRAVLVQAHRIVGFEGAPADIFHPEPLVTLAPPGGAGKDAAEISEGKIVSVFLQAVLDRRAIALDYRSPYGSEPEHQIVKPVGLFWDRNRWYLVGTRRDRGDDLRLWRADRVEQITALTWPVLPDPVFDVRTLLDRSWLRTAMRQWIAEAPVTIQLSRRQADLLRQDWYYAAAHFEEQTADHVLMTFGEDNRDTVLALLRWLGPEAELLAPQAWRAALRDELLMMLAQYSEVEPA